MSKQLTSPIPVGSQPYPSAEDVPVDSAYCRLLLNMYRHCFTCLKGECPTCRISYPRQFAKRKYFAGIVPDLTSNKDLVSTGRFSTDVTFDETICDPPLQTDNTPIDAVYHSVIASGLWRMAYF